MALFRRKKKAQPPQANEIQDLDWVSLARSFGDDDAAAFMQAFQSEPDTVRDWVDAIEASTWKRVESGAFVVHTGEDMRDVTEQFYYFDDVWEGTPAAMLTGLRIALGKGRHLIELDWKAEFIDTVSWFDRLLVGSGLASLSPEDVRRIEAVQGDEGIEDLQDEMGRLTTERNAALFLFDIDSDSYVFAICEPSERAQWDGSTQPGVLKLRAI